MDEEIKEDTKSETPEGTADDTSEGDKPEASGLIEGANSAAKRLETANQKTEELIIRQEEVAAKNALGGLSEAGQKTPEAVEETPEEYAEKVLKGEVNPFQAD